MIFIDYIIIALIGLSTLMSLIRGFICEIFSLLIWGLTFFISSNFYSYLTTYLVDFKYIVIKNSIAIILLFIMPLITGGISNIVMNFLIKKSGLSGFDRILGVCFGIFRGILIVSIILYFLNTFTYFSENIIWKQSQLIPKFNYLIIWFLDYLKSISIL
ncbi:Colicin V production protein [Serratia symbiotica]|nr:Colicin V production protein [Serratia symbiotica]